MGQTRETGARGRQFGIDMANKVAGSIGAKLIRPGRSNEAEWRTKRILIKSARRGVPQVGAT